MQKLVWFLFISLSLSSFFSFSQTIPTENQKLETLCKVWGFLKYHHPEVTKGKTDWDQQLIKMIPAVISSKDKNDLSNRYLDWIGSLGKVKTCRKSQNTVIPDSLKYNLNIDWIKDKNIFSDSLIAVLDHIYKNRSRKTNYNAKQNFWHSPLSYENKQPYKGMDFPVQEYRLLSLYRFWNVINYYYPYKNIIGDDWNAVLSEMMDRFRFPKDTIDYHQALVELISKINDSHSGMIDEYAFQYLGVYWAPFKIKIIDDRAVVTYLWNDSLSNIDHIKPGDEIVAINNKSIAEIVAERSKYFCASNVPVKLEKISDYLMNGNTCIAEVVLNRDGKQSLASIHRYKYQDLHLPVGTFYKAFHDSISMARIIAGHIGYVNMGKLQRKNVREVMKRMMPMDAIIFDVRNYPHQTAFKISKYLNQTKKPFMTAACPMKGNPGVFEYDPPQYCGSNNSKYYKGKVVILFDESTISHAEYTCMALQTAGNVTSIGSQTAGADGNVSLFTFPGGYEIAFTGIGVFYPDGRQTQRIGIVPDIKIKQTAEGIRAGRDEVLDRALEFIGTGK